MLSSITLLFKYLAPLPIHCLVTSRCMQFIFGDKREATYLIRECLIETRQIQYHSLVYRMLVNWYISTRGRGHGASGSRSGRVSGATNRRSASVPKPQQECATQPQYSVFCNVLFSMDALCV